MQYGITLALNQNDEKHKGRLIISTNRIGPGLFGERAAPYHEGGFVRLPV